MTIRDKALDRMPSHSHVVFERYAERMTTAEWKAVLLAERDTVIVGGHVRRLVAKKLGAGVLEIRKEPLKS